MKNKGIKFDNQKLPLELIPPEAIVAMARVLKHGAEKYAPRNWEKGISCERVIAAAERHLLAAKCGEVYDQDSGETHLAHALTEIAFAVAFIEREQDDMKGAPENAGEQWVLDTLNGVE